MKLPALLTAVTLAVGTALLSQTYAEAIKDITENNLKPDTKQKIVTRQVAHLLDKKHYLKQRLNNDNAPEVLNMYLDALDASRTMFLQSDVNEFKQKYATKIDDMLKRGDLSGAFFIFKRLQKRTQHYYEFAEKFLESDIDLNTDATINTDREEAPYFDSVEAQEDYWRKKLTLQLINITIAQKEEKAKEDALRENPELAKGQDLIRDDKRTPKEILQKRLNRKRGQISRLKSDTVVEGILNAALATYDPHSNYYAPVKATEINLQSNLSLEGIGVSIRPDRKDPDYTRIETIVEGGPASKTGQVKTGEFIIGVSKPTGEMVNVVGWSVREVVGLIRGKRGTEVTIRLQKPNGSEATARNVKIVRDVIEQEEQGVLHRTFKMNLDDTEKRIGVLEIPSFYLNYRARRNGENYRSVSEDTEKALKALNEQNIDGLVVDLRNNPGGSLDEVSKMLGLFIKQGSLVQIRDSRGNTQVYKDNDGGKQLFDKPMVVLINLASASASEIFAAAIQDYNRGIILGSTTTGKGSAQVQLDTIAHGQMTLTQRKFYRVTGGSTQNKGVEPDIDMINIYDDDMGEREQKHALVWDTIKTAPFKPEASFAKSLPSLTKRSLSRQSVDPQLVYLKSLKDLREQQEEDDKVIEVNLDKRLAKLHETEQKTLEIENTRRKATDLEPYKTWDIYQAALDAQGEERSKMKRNKRPKLPEDEAFVIEAASLLVDMINLKPEKQEQKQEQVQKPENQTQPENS